MRPRESRYVQLRVPAFRSTVQSKSIVNALVATGVSVIDGVADKVGVTVGVPADEKSTLNVK